LFFFFTLKRDTVMSSVSWVVDWPLYSMVCLIFLLASTKNVSPSLNFHSSFTCPKAGAARTARPSVVVNQVFGTIGLSPSKSSCSSRNRYSPTGTVGSLSPTHTQPYWVLLGVGFSRYSWRSLVSLSALMALRLALGSMRKSLAALRPRILSLISLVSCG